MDANQFKLNNNGNLSIETSTGESININGNDVTNREIITGVLNARLEFINPQIGDFKKRFIGTASMTPIEQAEYKYMEIRVKHLEKERNSLLNIVSELKSTTEKSHTVFVVKQTKLAALKIKMKRMVRDSEMKELFTVVDENIDHESGLYNQFLTNFSSYGRLMSENSTGTIPRDDFSISLNHITLSILSLIEKLKNEDLIAKS